MAEKAMYFADEGARIRYKIGTIIGKVFLYTFLTIFALFMLTPFVFMVVASFMNPVSFNAFVDRADFSKLGLSFGEEGNWSLSNYIVIFSGQGETSLGTTYQNTSFAQYYLNTIITSVGSTTVTVVTAVLAAFAFARLEFKGKNLLFTLLLATMMIPGEMMVITNYATTKQLHWEYTFSALIFVHGVSVFYIYYLRQNFQQIPNELYLAAKVDGVGDIGYLFKVMIPIAMPTITTIIILSLMGSWNSYIWPMLVANGRWLAGSGIDTGYDMRLVSNGLMSMFNTQADGENAIKIAGSMVVTAPLFVFFLIFRKYIMKGVSRSGIKG